AGFGWIPHPRRVGRDGVANSRCHDSAKRVKPLRRVPCGCRPLTGPRPKSSTIFRRAKLNTDKVSLRNAVKYALMAGTVSALATPAVFAADAAATTTTTTTDSNQSTAQLGKIEVTGTRIKRTDVETAQPVTIVTQKEIRATGLNSVGDIIAQLPQVRSMLNAQVNNGNDGSNTIDLRNLGSNRVLVLVNGKRWVASTGGTVDFGTIPAAVIDHIEVLQDGASAIYGSDAISGVVNIITIKNYNGAEANA